MASISYDVEGFGATLPNGLPGTVRGRSHAVGMAQLVWAAATVGVTPFGPRLHAGRALEVQWRSAMIRAAIQPGQIHYWRSARYDRLDPSEKGAVSFFLGQAQAKLFAHDFFRVSRFVHYDAYLAYRGRPRRKTRPDFIGFYGHHVAIGVEAKGRSGSFGSALVTNAKKQAGSLPAIQGHPASATYVHVAYFIGDQWCAYLEDPPRQRRIEAVDPALLATVYYLPIVNAIRAREPQTRGLEHADGSFLRAYFAEVDLHLSVRSDIAALTPTDDRAEALGEDERVARPLYELALWSDEQTASSHQMDDTHFFLGSDGVAVELGSSWQEWGEVASRG